MNKKISVVIPCYNEEEVLDELYKRVSNAMQNLDHDYEVICVDDGSKDRTFEILKSFNERNNRWKCISFSRNFGHQIAVSCGIHYSVGDALVILDADLQDPPEEVGRFIQKWNEGYEVVYGMRKKRERESLYKKFSAWLFYRLLSGLINFKIPLDTGDFCLMDRKVVNVMNKMPERSRFLRGMRAWSGFKQIGLTYDRPSRFKGVTKYSFKKMLTLAINAILSFSYTPLVFIIYAGVLCILLSFFIPSLVLFVGGLNLISMGILGGYLSRIYEEVKGRPLWIIKDFNGFENI